MFFIQSQSAFFQQMESRLKPLAQLEEFLDSNKIIFRYNSKVHTFSVIRADYLLQNDFNSSSLEGVRIAVEMFQEETGIRLCKVPLADLCGTLVIIKP
ncbi:PBECR4 domain-containing protein [Otoolea muris]|uniref:PBECR4 domain-containing protein n=1 Tax=Otoolea muris TaxID=2941515 RepID=UPI00203AF1FC|nr:PBECR4 domain-containing protein [Otoolea muris]